MALAPKLISARALSFITCFVLGQKIRYNKKNVRADRRKNYKGIFVVSRMLKITNNSLPGRFICVLYSVSQGIDAIRGHCNALYDLNIYNMSMCEHEEHLYLNCSFLFVVQENVYHRGVL